MFEELTDIDFGTYFNVVSNKPQENCNEDQFSDSSDASRPLMDRNNSDMSTESQQYYRFSNQRKNGNMNSILDWNNNNTSPIHSTPDSSPQSSSSNEDFIFSPPLNSPPFGLYRDTKSVNNFIVNNSTRSTPYSLNNILLHGDIPSIAIPSTPTSAAPSHIVFSQSDPVFPPTTPAKLPSLENNLSKFNPGGNTTEDREELVHPLDNNNGSEHETRNWRKPFGNYLRGVEPEKQLKKVAHNAIERRYRNNINDRIRELKNAVPALYKARVNEKSNGAESDDDESDEIIEGVQVAKKLNKATILKKATEYICHLKHTNDNATQENMILQQIIAQMPGGQEALQQFLIEKNEFEKFESQRIARERRETLEQERLERKKILRERAAQRAALAQLLPKQERKPYRRRQSSKKQDANDKKTDQNKMLMVGFMCIVFFTSAPNEASPEHHVYNNYEPFSLINQTTGVPSRSLSDSTTRFMPLDLWNLLRICVCLFGLAYICLIPLVMYWLRPRPVKKSKVIKKSDNFIHAIYSIIRNIFILLVPHLLAPEYDEQSTLSLVNASLKENASRVTMIQNNLQMLVQLYHCQDPLVKAHGYTVAGLQFNSTFLLRKAQGLVSGKINNPKEELDHYCKQVEQLQNSWLSLLNDGVYKSISSSHPLLQWLNEIGMSLQDDDYAGNSCMENHQSMIYHLFKASKDQTLLDDVFKYTLPQDMAESNLFKIVALCLCSKIMLEKNLDDDVMNELKEQVYFLASDATFTVPKHIQFLLE